MNKISFGQSKRLGRRFGSTQNMLAMKLTWIFIGIFSLGGYANTRGQTVDLNVKNGTVKEVFSAIRKQTGYRFICEEGLLKKGWKIDLAVKGDLKDALDALAANYPLVYRMHEGTIVVKERPQSPVVPEAVRKPPVHAQDRITGNVYDLSGAALAGVSVKVIGKQVETATDGSGRFSIGAGVGDSLSFSYLGFETVTVAVSGLSVNVTMRPAQAEDLDEVVVVGYGAVRRADLTGSIASVSAEQLTQVNAVSTIAQGLQGHAAGVQVSQASGQPGEFMRIKIRGTNSLGASNEPLYVVDGMPLDGLTSQLNPNDVESISVLKDASSTAIYGSRGANGVIMITTKKGKTGEPSISYSGYAGAQDLRKKMELIDAAEFAQLQNEVAANDGTPLPWSQQEIDALGAGTDWQDLVYRTALVHSHDFSLSGGSERTRYYSSFGYFGQDGIIRNSSFDRYSFRVNLEQKISDRLRFNTSFSVQQSNYERAQYQSADGSGGIPFTTMVMPPTQGVYNADGTYTRFTGVPWGQTNPVGLSENWHNPSGNLRLLGNVNLSYRISDGLKLNVSAGLDHGSNKTETYYPGNITLGQGTDADGQPAFGRASRNYGSSFSFLNENTLEYTKQVRGHSINALVGMTYQDSRSDGLNSGTALGFLSDIFQANNIQAAVTKALPSTSFNDNKLISYLGRANYHYNNKYYATFTARYDGSSRFGANNKFAFFPSGALAWAISEEDFLKGSEAVSNLKLRVSYGLSGNQAIANYQTLANLASVDVAFNNTQHTGFSLSALENRDLKWETTRQLDAGLDVGLLEGKLNITVDWYYKKTTDLLLGVNLPGSSGFSRVLQNVGAVRNRGLEFQASLQQALGGVAWEPTLTVSHNRTKVLDLGVDAHGNAITFMEIGTGGNWFPTIMGQSMMQLYGYTVEGIYQTDAEAVANGEPTKKAGDYRFRNWDGQGVVNDQDDRTVLSSFEPKFIFGFNNRFAYKRLDFSFLIVGSYGNDIANEFRKYNITMNGNWTPTREAFEQRWQGSGNAIDKPSANSGSAIRDYANSLWLEDGSYLRLRDVTLGYSFSPKVFRGRGASSVRAYVSLQNYLTITNYSGYDPEVSWASASIVGWDRGNYPSTKSITAGLNITF